MSWAEKAKSGGAALEGEIVDYQFTEGFPLLPEEDRTDTENVFLRLDVLPEGAEEAVQKPLYLGSGQFLQIAEDGYVLRHTEDGNTPRLYDQGDVYKLVESLEAADFPCEEKFPDPADSGTIDFRGLIGTRVRLVNEVDEEATKKFGKKKITKGKHKGKEFARTRLVVSKVLSLPTGAAKSAAKGTKTVTGKAGSKPVEEEQENDTEAADDFLVAMLKALPDNQIEKSALGITVTRKATKDKLKGEAIDAIRTQLVSVDYLKDAAKRGLIDVDFTKKNPVISLA